MNYEIPTNVQGTVTQLRIATFLCPSEPNDRPKLGGVVNHYPTSYGVDIGTWLVFDPNAGRWGDGSFGINANIRLASITDGLSHTLSVAEVKAFQPALKDGGYPTGANIPPPSLPTEPATYGGTFVSEWSHAEWVSGMVLQSGMTTTFPPNTIVPLTSAGRQYDIDFTASRLGTSTTRQTYVAVTSRSYHPGGVNVLLLDGSVRFIKGTVQRDVWRALGTRAGGEVVSDDAY